MCSRFDVWSLYYPRNLLDLLQIIKDFFLQLIIYVFVYIYNYLPLLTDNIRRRSGRRRKRIGITSHTEFGEGSKKKGNYENIK